MICFFSLEIKYSIERYVGCLTDKAWTVIAFLICQLG